MTDTRADEAERSRRRRQLQREAKKPVPQREAKKPEPEEKPWEYLSVPVKVES